jgi:RimJ/RimL family protein N-acetyltransferase
VILQTPRLTVRPLELDDAPFVLELVNEPPWLAHIGNKGIHSPEDAAGYIRNGPMRMYAERGFGLWAVERNESHEPIGICGLIKRDTLADIDIGFAFLQRVWGNGYALEAAAATLAHGTDVLHLERIVAVTTRANRRSSDLLRKLGFRFERNVRLDTDGDELELYAIGKDAAAGQ